MLSEGDKAPAFSTNDSQGQRVKLSDFRGRKVVLYFYPRDNTPGCTKEACSFRDDFPQFQKLGVQVLGVSPDTEASHQKFITKFDLPFTLLTDPDHAIAEAYSTYGEKTFMGRKFLGIHRTTFLIGEDGRIAKIFRKVKAEGHAKEVLAAARA
jgi:thioredoxin-dependent peroxiredoxin